MAQDLSHFSDQDLEALALGDVTKLSDQGLDLVHAHMSQENEAKVQDQQQMGTAALEHAGNAASLGYLPQIQAAAEPITSRLGDLLTGQNVTKDLPGYTERRDENIARQEQQQQNYPVASTLGTVGGAVAGGIALSAATPIKAATGVGRMLKAGGVAAATGAISNPGDVKGETGLQLGDRARNAAFSAPLGIAGQAVAEGLGAVGHKVADSASKFAHEKALQAAGAMKKDYKMIFSKHRADELGAVLLDKNFVTPFATTAKIAERLEGAQNEAGKEIGHILDKVDLESVPYISAKNIAITLSKDPDIQSLSKIPGKEGVFNQVKKYLKTLTTNGDHLNLRDAQRLRQGIDESINFNKRVPEMAGAQPYLYKMRDALSETMNDVVNAFDELDGIKSTDRLKVANLAYSQITTLKDVADNRTAAFAANRAIGLTDTISGGAGATVGASIGHASGLPGAGKMGAVVGGAIGALGNKAARTFGPGLMSTWSNSIVEPSASMGPIIQKFVSDHPALIPVLTHSSTRTQKNAVDRRLEKSKKGN